METYFQKKSSKKCVLITFQNKSFAFVCELTLAYYHALGANINEIEKWYICIPYYVKTIKPVMIIYGTTVSIQDKWMIRSHFAHAIFLVDFRNSLQENRCRNSVQIAYCNLMNGALTLGMILYTL